MPCLRQPDRLIDILSRLLGRCLLLDFTEDLPLLRGQISDLLHGLARQRRSV
jgi:hypothetical protein